MKKVGIIVGSLRKEAYSKKVAQNLALMLPNEIIPEFIEIGTLPLFNEDLEDQGVLEWTAFKSKITDADALLFVTPEYNRSIPGVLKNAIDVGSRPAGDNSWNGKPAMIISNSPGSIGGFGASQHLKQVALAVGMTIIQPAEVYLSRANALFAKNGLLNNDSLGRFLNQVITSLVQHILSAPATDKRSSQSQLVSYRPTPTQLIVLNSQQQTVGNGIFSINNRILTITEVTVDPDFRGLGIAAEIVVKLILLAQIFNLKINPVCPYAKTFFEKHSGAQKILI